MKALHIDKIVSGGSPDSILTTAALMRLSNCTEVTFTQPHEVGGLDPKHWDPGQKIGLVLAVDNRNTGTTKDFVKSLVDNGHELVAIVDEHDSGAWQHTLAACGLRLGDLIIQPEDPNYMRAAGSVLIKWMSSMGIHDPWALLLCREAEASDDLRPGYIAQAVAKATKASISDNQRRAFIARSLSKGGEIAPEIQEWISEYDQIQAATDLALRRARRVAPGVYEAQVGSNKRPIIVAVTSATSQSSKTTPEEWYPLE